jgi:hypothetical protein
MKIEKTEIEKTEILNSDEALAYEMPEVLTQIISLPVITETAIFSLADNLEIPASSADVVKLNILKKILDRLDTRMKDDINKNGFNFYDSYHGVKIEKSTTPTSFKLDEDAEYLQLKEKLDARAKLLKQQAKLFQDEILKGRNSDDFTGLVIDGEQIPVVQMFPGKESVKISFPKK